MAKSKVTIIVERITTEIQKVVESEFFKEWRQEQSFLPGDVIVFNNSFLFRGRTNTSKSEKFLGLRFDDDSRIAAEPLVLYRPGQIINEIKRLSVKQFGRLEYGSLRDEIRAEQDRLGSIVLSLVGNIGEDESAAVDVSDFGSIKRLCYSPGQEQVSLVQDDCVALNQLENSELLWEATERILEVDSAGDGDLELAFKRGLNLLRNIAHIPVLVDEISETNATVLGKVVDRLDRQVADYANSLRRYRSNLADSEARNELLRIAYNFADGAQGLTKLITGISDLKPLVLWLTLESQLALALAFKTIPLTSSSSEKPSFEKYRTAIANARNHAFHDIFALGRTFKVRLPSDAFSGAEMLIFRDYSARNTSALDFDDRKIVELLDGLTRTSEQAVPAGFWEENQEVMRCTVSLANSLKSALTLLGGK